MENIIYPKSSPRDVFLHLLVVITLYVSVVSLIFLLFAYIEVLFPDALNSYYSGILDQIRWSSSTLIIVFPVYILLNWLLARDVRAQPEKRELKVRRWLVYFTLFLAAITIIVDLITLVYRFYSGEIATQFILKVLAILLVAGAVFGYYLWDLRKWTSTSRQPRLLAWVSSAIVLVLIIAGFFMVGSPAKQRERRFDETRVNDLQLIQSQIINYWSQKERLPANLTDLNDSLSGFVPPVDPESEAHYEYTTQGPLNFTLCATFKTNSLDVNSTVRKPLAYPYLNESWNHGVGRVCFARTIDPELYRLKVPVR